MTSEREQMAQRVAHDHLVQAVRELAVAVYLLHASIGDPDDLLQLKAYRSLGDAVRHLRELGGPHYSDANTMWDVMLEEFADEQT